MHQRLGHIFLVDDNHDFRFYLSDMLSTLGYTVDVFDNSHAFLDNALDVSPAVVLLDMKMPGLNGLDLQARLVALNKKTPVVFISGESDKDQIIEAFKFGAVDFLLKPIDREKLCAAVDKALALDRQKNAEFANIRAIRRTYDTLSKREKEIFTLIAEGKTNMDIAQITGTQPNTAKKHRANIYQKFQVNSTAEVMRMCRQIDLTQLIADH
ncbi:response regulator transcription factor [Limnohabitans sp.]|jgi:FixJ family two-component response regulator|uniref:response regulator transcription factor n=1 Tax=Limnohabitans sp. TaxID=1907725 RepID=UPI0039BCAB9B|nr:response regulator [Comamonadaceae bacterium]